MKKYNIKVNGTSYEVEVEELSTGGASAPSPAPSAPKAATPAPKAAAPAPPKATEAAAPAEPSAGAVSIDSPMPGTILDVMVAPGQAVAEGDILLILEAMKMENEILAPSAGTVDTVPAVKGAAVNAGEVLVTLK